MSDDTSLTPYEYQFLTDMWVPEDKEAGAYLNVGVDCYEQGWIDDFGMVTPLGMKAIKKYEAGE